MGCGPAWGHLGKDGLYLCLIWWPVEPSRILSPKFLPKGVCCHSTQPNDEMVAPRADRESQPPIPIAIVLVYAGTRAAVDGERQLTFKA